MVFIADRLARVDKIKTVMADLFSASRAPSDVLSVTY